MNKKKALLILKENGYKLTSQRKEMIHLFVNNNKYLTAKEILQEMEKNYSKLSFDTIYRNLSLFVDLGILEMTELDSEKHFRNNCSHSEHHHHFICMKCGITKQIESCPMDNITEDLSDYVVEDHKFEIYGRCPQCVAY